MTTASNSRVLRTIPLLIVVCLVSLPAHAKYSGGTGEPNDPYQIATAEDLMLLGESPDDYDKHFIMTADIDLDPNLPGQKVFGGAVIAADVNDNERHFQGTPFTGVFDGNGHIISNLTIKGQDYLGLFGFSGEAVISNLGLEEVDITGIGRYIGALTGFNTWYTSITSIYSTGRVTGNQFVGGLVGKNLGIITSCYNYCMVKQMGDPLPPWFGGIGGVGGLAGSNGLSIIGSCNSGKIIGDNIVGGLAGNNSGSISKSHNSGTVEGLTHVGGIVGSNYIRLLNSNSGGTIATSSNNGKVQGETNVGGLAGYNAGDITDSYSTGQVNGATRVGGLVGLNSSEGDEFLNSGLTVGEINASYSTGLVEGNENVGGLVGLNLWLGNVQNNCFWDIETSGQTTSDGGMGKTTVEIQKDNTFLDAGWDFVGETENGSEDIWKIVEGQIYPLLSWQKYGGGTGKPNDPYLIYTAEHLNELGAEPNDYDKHFKLMVNIDLSGHVYDRAVIAPDVNNVEDGFQGIPFTGTFVGSGHAISNLTMDGGSYLGLFGNLVDFSTIITNVRLGAVSVSGTGDCVGSLVGQNYAKIVSCHSSGTIVGKRDVGGLIGRNDFAGSRILKSSSECTVMGDMSVGGLVGFMSSGRVKQCFSTGAVTGKTLVGGLVGLNGSDSSTSGGFGGNPYVEDSYSASTVTGEGDAYGYGGEVVGIGGLVGFNGGYVYNSYSMGLVGGSGLNVGGLVGREGNWSGIVGRSFWDTQTSAQVSCGWWVSGCIGKTTTEMQTASTFLEAGWDFIGETANGTEDIWWILEGQDYPKLWWEAAGK